MQAPFDNIVQHLFHQPSLHSVTVDELEQMALQHPYFAAAHFLLLKKMQDTGHPDFTAQLQKTTIYFNNPLWLQFLLQPENVANFTVSEKPPFISSEPATTENNNDNTPAAIPETTMPPAVDSPAEASPYQPTDTNKENAAAQDEEPEIVPAEHGGIMDVITAAFSDPNPLYSPGIEPGDTETEATSADESIHQDGSENNDFHEQAAVEDNNTITTEDTAAQPAIPESMASAGAGFNDTTSAPPADESIQPDPSEKNDFHEQTAVEDSNTMAAEDTGATGALAQEENNAATVPGTMHVTDHSTEITAGAIPIGETAENYIAVPASEQQKKDENIIDTETGTGGTNKDEPVLIKTIIETPAAKNDLLFEPYYTVDYFASQGIKLSKQEAEGKDKLGRQLKSFTEWLRTMKKLPQVSIEKILAENEESKVVEDAIHSLDNKEVVTEAMAAVFEKQGMYEKATGIYQKLSLQNPSKSAYFAARIDALKH